MADKNDIVIIELDRPRELRYGHKALKLMLADLNLDFEELDLENADLDTVEKMIYYGLLTDAKRNGEQLKLENMEDLLDEAPSMEYYMNKMIEAFNKSFGQYNTEVDQKNLEKAVKTSKKTK